MADEERKSQGRDLLAAFAEGAEMTNAELRDALLAAHRQIGRLETQNADMMEQLERQEALLTIKDEVIGELEERVDELEREVVDTEVALVHSAAETMDVKKQWYAAEEKVDRTQGQLEAQKQQNAELEQAAITDPLTGLLNRKGGEIKYAELVNEAVRHTRELAQEHEKNPQIDTKGPKKAFLCAMLIDIDHFKNVNDTHGHNMGDTVLQSVAGTLVKTVAKVLAGVKRPNDLLIRYGGEEIAGFIIVEAYDLSEARGHVAATADRMRKAVQKEGYSVKGVQQNLTISVGVDAFLPEEKVDVPTIEDLNRLSGKAEYASAKVLESSDFNLYQAKENRRNAVVVKDEELGRLVIFDDKEKRLVIKQKEEKKGPPSLPLIDYMEAKVPSFKRPAGLGTKPAPKG